MQPTLRRLARRVSGAIPFKAAAFGRLQQHVRLPHHIYQHLHFKGCVQIPIDDHHGFSIHHFGYQVENDLFWAGYGHGWEATSLTLWARLAPLAGTILDIGANTGVYALAAAAMNPNARVFAFEPVAHIYEKLTANVALNRFGIITECLALSDKTGKSEMFGTEGDHAYAATLESNSVTGSGNGNPQFVRTVRLDEYLCKTIALPALAKIDVECHEPAVLRGFGQFLRESKPTILMEILSDSIATEIEGLVEGLGYQIYEIIEGTGAMKIAGLNDRQRQNCNYLLCQPGVAKELMLDDLQMEPAC